MQLQFSSAFKGDIHRSFLQHGTNGSAALLVHGFPGTPGEMRPLAQLLNEAGWTVHAVLLPGFGAEVDTLRDKTHSDWYRSIQQAHRELKKRHQHIVLIGHSMGGALCLRLAAEESPDGLILFAPFWQIDHLLWYLLPVLKHIIPRFKPFRLFKPDFSNAETRKGIQNFLPDVSLDDRNVQESILNFEIPTGMLDEVRITGQKGQAAIARITCPTLVLQGKDDTLVRPDRTRQLIGYFACAIRYTEVDGTHDLTNPAQSGWQMICSAIHTFIRDFNLAGSNDD